MSKNLIPYENWLVDPRRTGAALDDITEKQMIYIEGLLAQKKNSNTYSLEGFEELTELPFDEWSKHDAAFFIKLLLGDISRLTRCSCGNAANIRVYFEYVVVDRPYDTPMLVCGECATKAILALRSPLEELDAILDEEKA